MTLTFTVLGEPMSKGSKTARVNRVTGFAYLHEDKSVEKKRNAAGIAAVALDARGELPLLRDVALHVTLRFYTGSPSYRYGTGRNAGLLKDSAAARPAKKPDVDKWARHTLDALTGVVYADDGQVVSLLCEKFYAEGDLPPRTEVEVSVLPQQTVGVIVADSQLALAA